MWKVDRDKDYSFEELFNKIEDEKLTELEDLSVLITCLFTDSDVSEPDSTLRKNYEISEEKLRNCVKKILLKIENRNP